MIEIASIAKNDKIYIYIYIACTLFQMLFNVYKIIFAKDLILI